MKTEEFDNRFRKKLSEVKYKTNAAEADALYDKLKAGGNLKTGAHLQGRKLIYFIGSALIIGAGAFTIYTFQKNEQLQHELTELRQEINYIKSQKSIDTNYTFQENPIQPITAAKDNKEVIYNSPGQNMVSNSVKRKHISNQPNKFNLEKGMGLQKKAETNKDETEVQNLERKDFVAEKLYEEKPETIEPVNILQKDSIVDAQNKRVKKPENPSKTIFYAGISGEMGRQLNTFGVQFGWKAHKNLELGLGLQKTDFHPERYRNEHDYRNKKGSEFHQDYREYMPKDTHDIRDIRIESHIYNLPVFLTWHSSLYKKLGWYGTAGVTLVMRTEQLIDFHGPQLPDEQEQFKTRIPGSIMGPGFIGAGLEGNFGKYQIASGVQVFTRWERGNFTSATAPVLFKFRLVRSLSL